MRKHITTALILLLCACGVREISIDGLDEYKMDTVGTIRLAEEIDIEDLLTVGKNYIVLDSFNDKYEIKIFDEKGSILFRYGKKGKGPGEFSESDLILAGIHNGRLYVADSDVNKIVAFKMDGDSSFAFEDEFFIDSGSMIRGGMTGAGEMAFSLVQDDHMLKTFNTDGVKTAEYIPIEIPDINKMSRRELLTFLRSNLFFPVRPADLCNVYGFSVALSRFDVVQLIEDGVIIFVVHQIGRVLARRKLKSAITRGLTLRIEYYHRAPSPVLFGDQSGPVSTFPDKTRVCPFK